MAAKGWRLVSTAAGNYGALQMFIYMFFEREVPERR
jgi:hypothetical protein